jgi:autotransporter-associated beta strand protein
MRKIIFCLALATATNLLTTAIAQAGSLFGFGDSLVDNGNIPRLIGGNDPPSPPYFQHRYSNGPAFVEYLPKLLGLNADVGTVYGKGYDLAVGGAESGSKNNEDPRLPGLANEISLFSSRGRRFRSGDMVVVWAGALDYANSLIKILSSEIPSLLLSGTLLLPQLRTVRMNVVDQTTSNLADAAVRLAGLGAKQVVFVNLPDLGKTLQLGGNRLFLAAAAQISKSPLVSAVATRLSARIPQLSALATQLTDAHNQQLELKLARVHAQTGINIILFDVNLLFKRVLADPAKYGFSNVTDMAIDTAAVHASQSVQNTYLFWDDGHPTTAFHLLLARYLANMVDVPSVWDGGRTIAGGTIQGGNGVWNNTNATWSSTDGLSKNIWNGYWAVFGSNAGTVDVQDDVYFHKIQFIADGYTIHSSNNSKLLVDNPAIIRVDSTYQADISAEIGGDGSISKAGDGTLILSHDNSYTGGTVLDKGILVANSSNALSSGSVILQGGVLRLGSTHTLQVGSYTQNRDAILALRVNSPTSYDRLVVNGNANLGGTLLIDGKPSNFNKEMFLITTQNLNGSRFDSIQFAQRSLKELSANYDDTKNVYVTSHFAPIWPYAISRNARALARNLDLFSNTGRKRDLFKILADLRLPEVPAALEKLVPRQVFTLSSIGSSVSRSLMRSLLGRLEDLSSGYTSYGQFNASASNQDGLPSVGVLPQINFLMSKDQERWSFYMRGNGGFGRQRQDNENEVVGYDYGQGGTFIGADYSLNEKFYVGGAVSYTYTDANFYGDRGSLNTDSYFAHLYVAYTQPKGLSLISSLSVGDHEFDLKRRALTDTARSQPQSREVDFQSQVSYNILLKPNFMVSPYVGLAYGASWMEDFQEYNSQGDLKISDDQTNSLRSTIGVKVKYEKPFTKGIQKASVETNLAWEYEYFDTQPRGINAKWVGSGVPSFRVHGSRIGPDTLINSVNLRLSVTNLLSVIIGYDITANQDYVSHGFSIGINRAF